MPNWRKEFERSAAVVPGKQARQIRYRFGPPATESGLAALEGRLGGPIPYDLRSMLEEFNGIEVRDKYWGDDWRPLYLNIEQMLVDAADYMKASGNPLPPPDELAGVAFFAHQNGFSELFAICMRAFSGYKIGNILVLDHETGEFEFAEESLSDFVCNPEYCVL